MNRFDQHIWNEYYVLQQTYGQLRFILLKNALLKSEKDIVLDIGCGTGHNLIGNSNLIHFGVGIDVSEERLKKAMDVRQKLEISNITLIESSALFLPLKNSSIDAVICTEVLEHILEDESVIEECSRVLKSKGKVYMSVPSRKMLFPGQKFLRKKVDIDHVRPGYTIEEIKSILQNYNIKIINIGYYGQLVSSYIHYLTSFWASKRKYKITEGPSNKNLLYLFYRLIWPILWFLSGLDTVLPRSLYGGFIFLEAEKTIEEGSH